MQFKKGQMVHCYEEGKSGVITEIVDTSVYPVVVGFEDGKEERYTLDGRWSVEMSVSLYVMVRG